MFPFDIQIEGWGVAVGGGGGGFLGDIPPFLVDWENDWEPVKGWKMSEPGEVMCCLVKYGMR